MSDSENDFGGTIRIKLRQRQVEVLYDLTPPHTWQDIDRVVIEIEESFAGFTQVGLQVLEGSIEAATSLKSINIERLVQATTSIPVSVLTRILRLRSMNSLEDLRVLGTRLAGTKEEWLELAQQFEPKHRPCLEFVCLVEPISWLEHIPAGALDPLMRVCANHMRLKFVASNLFSGLSLEAIDDFCQSPYIAGLHLVDTDVSDERVFRFLKNMQTNTKVWFLSVAFAEDLSAKHGKAIADLLKENVMISNLSIKSKKPIHEDLVYQLSNGLVNASVEQFSIEGDGVGPTIGNKTRRAISNMLEQNKCILQFRIDGATVCDGLAKEIKMMLRLNSAGRKLLINATSRQWVDVLSKDNIREDLDCIYYLLSKNPELFHCHGSEKKLSNVSSSRKRKYEEYREASPSEFRCT